MPLVISIEGNIGSGKSTIINEMKKTCFKIYGLDVVYVDEPVTQWEQIKSKDGKNMLELFYADPVKYSFSFQMMAYISRLILLKEAIKNNQNKVIITERCLLTDYNIFASMLYEQGKMSEEEYTIYKKWFHYFQNDIVMTAIIYVQCDPEISHARCLKRCRSGEDLSLEYLTDCHTKHEDWMNREMMSTIVINNNDELDEERMNDIMFEITCFISDEIYNMKHEPNQEFFIYSCFIFMYMIFVLCCIR